MYEREAVDSGLPFAPSELFDYFLVAVDSLNGSYSSLLQPRGGDWGLWVRVHSFGFDLFNGQVPQGVGQAFAPRVRDADGAWDDGRRVRARQDP